MPLSNILSSVIVIILMLIRQEMAQVELLSVLIFWKFGLWFPTQLGGGVYTVGYFLKSENKLLSIQRKNLYCLQSSGRNIYNELRSSPPAFLLLSKYLGALIIFSLHAKLVYIFGINSSMRYLNEILSSLPVPSDYTCLIRVYLSFSKVFQESEGIGLVVPLML